MFFLFTRKRWSSRTLSEKCVFYRFVFTLQSLKLKDINVVQNLLRSQNFLDSCFSVLPPMGKGSRIPLFTLIQVLVRILIRLHCRQLSYPYNVSLVTRTTDNVYLRLMYRDRKLFSFRNNVQLIVPLSFFASLDRTTQP